MTGNSLLAELRMRLNDEGDDTQDSSGVAAPKYFWADAELLYYMNAAVQTLYRTLVGLRKMNELKNLVATTAATTVPANYYMGFAATVDGVHAVVIDDPRTALYLYNGRTKAVHVIGTAINRVGGAAHVLTYWKRPAAIAWSGAALTEMTTQFYETALDIAEQDATHKDNAIERIVLRRTFGAEDIQYVSAQKYLANAA